MDLDTRSAILFGVLVFLILFAGMTFVVLFKDGLTILVVFAILILAIIGVGLWGAVSEQNRRGAPALARQVAQEDPEDALERVLPVLVRGAVARS